MKTGDQLAVDYGTWEVIKKDIDITALSYSAFDIGVAKHMDVFGTTKQHILTEYKMANALTKI